MLSTRNLKVSAYITPACADELRSKGQEVRFGERLRVFYSLSVEESTIVLSFIGLLMEKIYPKFHLKIQKKSLKNFWFARSGFLLLSVSVYTFCIVGGFD